MKVKNIKTSNGKKITIYDDVLDYADRSDFYEFVSRSLFKTRGTDTVYLEHSSDRSLLSSYSGQDLINSKILSFPEMKPILEKVEGYEYIQIRVNLCTFNDKNHFHTDSSNKNSLTLLYYPNMEWHPEWGGLTMFANDDISDLEYVSFYKPGRFILFDGTIPHCISPPTSIAPAFRYSFVIQYEKK